MLRKSLSTILLLAVAGSAVESSWEEGSHTVDDQTDYANLADQTFAERRNLDSEEPKLESENTILVQEQEPITETEGGVVTQRREGGEGREGREGREGGEGREGREGREVNPDETDEERAARKEAN